MTLAMTVLYDADCGICTHTARVFATLDRRRRIDFVPLRGSELSDAPPRHQLEGVLHARNADGTWFTGGEVFVQIARRIPILVPLSLVARLPFAMPAIDAAYDLVARNRRRLSQLLGLKVCQVRSPVGSAGSSE